jgi:hypothetical protein
MAKLMDVYDSGGKLLSSSFGPSERVVVVKLEKGKWRN